METVLTDETVFKLVDVIDYEEGSIASKKVLDGPTVRLMLKAFDEGCALPEHAAPGKVVVFALEGEAAITYKGIDYAIKAGENFVFEKGAPHSVVAHGRYKMALLVLLD